MKKIVITKHARKRISERLKTPSLLPNGKKREYSLGEALNLGERGRNIVIKTIRSVGEDNYEFLIKGNKLAAVFNKINDRERPVVIFEGDGTTVYIKTVYTECKEPYEITRQSTCTDLIRRIGKDLTY